MGKQHLLRTQGTVQGCRVPGEDSKPSKAKAARWAAATVIPRSQLVRQEGWRRRIRHKRLQMLLHLSRRRTVSRKRVKIAHSFHSVRRLMQIQSRLDNCKSLLDKR